MRPPSSPVSRPTPDQTPRSGTPADGPAASERCDYCGSGALRWRKCKLVCDDCRQINKSCADL